jgi:Cu/Ag efflux pump CusA
MAYAIIGGLFVATLLTLLFLPARYFACSASRPRREHGVGVRPGAPAMCE